MVLRGLAGEQPSPLSHTLHQLRELQHLAGLVFAVSWLALGQASDQIKRALASLPDRQREAIVLQYYQEFSNIEAAQIMDISIEALESLLARARRNLRTALEETAQQEKAK